MKKIKSISITNIDIATSRNDELHIKDCDVDIIYQDDKKELILFSEINEINSYYKENNISYQLMTEIIEYYIKEKMRVEGIDWSPDWKNHIKKKYYLYYNYFNTEIISDYVYQIKSLRKRLYFPKLLKGFMLNELQSILKKEFGYDLLVKFLKY